MPLPIEMPKLSDTMTEGTLVQWRKAVGDPVAVGDVLAEIETDKAIMEMEAFDDGVLAEIRLPAGQRGAVGQTIGVLALPGESGAENTPSTPSLQPAEAVKEDIHPPLLEPITETTEPPRIKASPLALKQAEQHGVDLRQLTGTGPAGRITEKDVLAAVAAKTDAMAAGSGLTTASLPTAPASATPDARPLSEMRRVIAGRLVASKTAIPHFYLQLEADAEPMLRLRAELNAGLGEPEQQSVTAPLPVIPSSSTPSLTAPTSTAPPPAKITLNDLILKATALALRRVPGVNASWVEPGEQGQASAAEPAIVEHPGIHLAVAVAVGEGSRQERGLVTPVLRDADRLPLGELSAAVRQLAARARARRLRPEDYRGGTFTVSNLGAHGIGSFYAIINPPQAAILSVGAVTRQPVVNAAGEVVAGWRITLGLSADHRVVDGALGARFLGEVRRLLESPARMLV